MQFDNAQFERNVRTSIGTLDRLKQSLNLTGAAKGLENVNAAAKDLDMSPLANGLETVKAKFSALEVMAVTSLANITNSAVNAGKRLVSAFTIDPIKTGFQEYETQINAVQTILSNTRSKGTTLDQVNEALDELNHYADMTIYNFTEMTRNIGTFTAAGVDLDTSVSAIKGIANLAAVSGSTSQQASTAMYQLSQALAAGTVKLQDWNSVVNAGMGGQVFQDALKETARVHGIAIDDMIKKEGSFRETLSKGWLSSQILTETLAKFTGDLTEEQLKSMGYTDEQAKSIMALGEDANNAATKVKTFTQLLDTLKEAAQSGWTQTWEYIVGDFEDAKKLWTSVSDTLSEMINQSAEARNKVIGEWAENDGRAAAIEAIKSAFEGLMNIIKPVKEAFREVFPPITSKQLIEITEKIWHLTVAFKHFTRDNADKIQSTFKGLFSILKIGVTVVKAIVKGVTQLVGKIIGLSGGLLSITGSLGDWIGKIAESINETNLFGRAVDTIVGLLGKAIDKVKSFFKAIGEKVDSSSLEDFSTALKNIWDLIGKLGEKIGSAFGELFRSGDIQNALGILNSGLLTSIFLGLKKAFSGGGPNKVVEFLQNLLNPLENLKEKLEPVTGMLDELKGCLEAYQQDLRAKTLIKIATAIGILAAALFVISAIDPGDLASALTGMAVLFAELVGAMAALDKFAGGYKNSAKSVALMTAMSASILILAGALKMLSGLKWGELAVGLTGVLGLMTILVGAMKVLSANRKQFIKGASQMVIMAAALKILASVCKDLSQLSWEQLAKGVSGIGGILLTFVGYQTLMSLIKPTKMMRAALSLAIIGGAMEIFADVCKKLGGLDWGQLAKAGAGMAGILAIAAGFGILSGLAKKMAGSAVALAILGGAMEIFADVCQKFGAMELGELAKAGVAIAGVLAFAAGFALLSGLAKDMRGSVISLTIMAAAMEIFADVCRKFAGMEWEGLAKAGSAIAGILLLCSGFALLASLSGGILKAAGALAIMSVALAVIAPVLKVLGGMSWGAIAKGLVAIAGAFAIMWGAAIMLTPVIPSILALAGAIALLGVAALAFGAGVTLLGTGITALAIALAAGATAIVSGILTILEGIGQAILLIGKAIIEGAAVIGAAIAAVIIAAIDALVQVIPSLAEGIMQILIGVLDALVNYAPKIVEYLFKFLIGLLDALGAMIPQFVTAAVNFLGKIFSGVVDALKNIDTKTLVNAILGVGLVTAFMLALNAIAGLVPGAMVGVLGLGAVVAELGLVLAALGGLAQIPGLEWLISEGGDFLQKVGTAIGKFIGGIVGGVAEGVTSALPGIGTNLSLFMMNIQPFLLGAKLIDQGAMDGVKSLVEVMALLTGASFLESINSWLTGGSSFTDFAAKLVAFGQAMKQYADTISGMDTAAVEASAKAGAALAELAKNLPSEGGLLQSIIGSKDLSSFGNKLVRFGLSMKMYSLAISGMDADAVANSAIAGKALSDLASSLPNSDGILQSIIGSKDLGDFGDKLVQFGLGMRLYSLSVTGLDVGAIAESVTAAHAISELAASLPKSDGVAQFFSGSKDLDSFGDKLSAFGESMKTYSDKVADINLTAVMMSTTAFTSFIGLAKNASEVKYDGLLSLGSNLRQFAISIKDLDADKMQTLATSTATMAELSKNVSGANFSVFEALGRSLKTMMSDVSNLDSAILDSVVSSIGRLVNSGIAIFVREVEEAGGQVGSAGQALMDNFARGIITGQWHLRMAWERVARSLFAYICLQEGQFGNVGKVLMAKFANGLKSNSLMAASAFSTSLSNSAKRIRDYYAPFYNAGKYVADGFANGIEANTYKAQYAASAMAAAAEKATRARLRINSPSKVFREDGYTVPEGFAQGIDRMSWLVKDSATAMAKEAIKGTGNAISRIADLVSTGMDTEPTIRPVLDLSNVSAGANRLNNMLNLNPSVGVLSNLNTIGSGMNKNQNGATNDDIISAIKSLGSKISSSGDTYSINGITIDDSGNVSEAVKTLVRAARLERRA
jgi:tape measure domain-containing protein